MTKKMHDLKTATGVAPGGMNEASGTPLSPYERVRDDVKSAIAMLKLRQSDAAEAARVLLEIREALESADMKILNERVATEHARVVKTLASISELIATLDEERKKMEAHLSEVQKQFNADKQSLTIEIDSIKNMNPEGEVLKMVISHLENKGYKQSSMSLRLSAALKKARTAQALYSAWFLLSLAAFLGIGVLSLLSMIPSSASWLHVLPVVCLLFVACAISMSAAYRSIRANDHRIADLEDRQVQTA
ncbi:MAG: hypothetical protein H6591_09200 [Flavobacteriales bacterium]|nr:hypothetical protein [Flavobacteriales bacterium]